jgi:hypothetical protein
MDQTMVQPWHVETPQINDAMARTRPPPHQLTAIINCHRILVRCRGLFEAVTKNRCRSQVYHHQRSLLGIQPRAQSMPTCGLRLRHYFARAGKHPTIFDRAWQVPNRVLGRNEGQMKEIDASRASVRRERPAISRILDPKRSISCIFPEHVDCRSDSCWICY